MIAELAQTNPALARTLDAAGLVPAAEAVFVSRHEFPVSLVDIVHRRMMVGLDADQGNEVAAEIAQLVAPVMGWTRAETNRQLEELASYNRRLRPEPATS